MTVTKTQYMYKDVLEMWNLYLQRLKRYEQVETIFQFTIWGSHFQYRFQCTDW